MILAAKNTGPDKKRLALLGKLARGSVLDVGCYDLPNPHLSGAVGFDLKRPQVIPPNYSNFVRGDCQELDRYFSDNTFDTIIAGEVIEHLECPASFLRAAHKALKGDGQLLLTTPNPYHWTTVIGNLCFVSRDLTNDHINLFPYRALLALFNCTGWQCVKVLDASGGMRLWHTTRSIFIPCPKALAWQHLYLCKKKINP